MNKIVFVANVLQDSRINNVDIIYLDIITHVNGIQIKNLNDYLINIKKYEEIEGKRFITLKNNLNKKSVLIIDNIIEEEKFYLKNINMKLTMKSLNLSKRL